MKARPAYSRRMWCYKRCVYCIKVPGQLHEIRPQSVDTSSTRRTPLSTPSPPPPARLSPATHAE